MKSFLLALPLLLAGAAFGQSASIIPSEARPITIPAHPQHAEQHSMATEHALVGSTDTYSYGHGEVPLWELGPFSEPTPLGDVAREFRKEKLTAKKATVIFEKQGSTVSR